jgi:hypothetical protein
MATLDNDIRPSWKVIIDDAPLSVSQASFEPESSTAMIPYRIPYEDLDFAPQHFIGYSYVSAPFGGSGTETLRRVLPQPHPFWDGFWANRLAIQGEVGTRDHFAPPVRNANRHGPHDAYPEYRVEVYYARRPYDVRYDGEVAKEQSRYVEKLPGKPYSEVVTIEGGQLKFTTRNGETVSDGAVLGQGVGFRVGKTAIRWVWHEVPVKWVLNSNGIPSQLALRIGTINNAPWEGFATNTLYLDEIDMEYTWSTSSPVTLGLASWQPPRYVKVGLMFKHFREGWNRYPYPGLGTWDLVAWKDNLTKRVYEETDFDDLFKKAT